MKLSRRALAACAAWGAVACGEEMHLGLGFPMGGASFAAPVPFVPTDIAGALVWLSADATTDTGDGTEITACTDQSPNGCVITKGGTGPLRLDASGRRGKKLISFPSPGTARTLRTSNAALAALATGAAKDFTITWVFQPMSTTLTYMGGWGRTVGFSHYMAFRRGSGNLLTEVARNDSINNSNLALSPTARGLFPQTLSIVHDATAGTLQVYEDGIAFGSPVAFPWNSAAVKDMFTWGSLFTQSESISALCRIRHNVVHNSKLTAPQLANMASWGAREMGEATTRMNWKRGAAQSASFGNGSNATLVIWCIGASQGTAYATTTPYVSIYANTSQQAYGLFPDGNLAPLGSVMTTENTDAAGLVQDSGASAGGQADPWIRMVDYLRANGETRNIIVVNRCLGSTTSLSWDSGLASTPLAANGAYGSACYYVDEALKAPNAELIVCVAQSESNCAEPPFGGATVANWTSGWTNVLNAINTRYAAYFVKTKRFMIGRQPATPATGYSGHWAEMRTAIAAFVTGRSDCVQVDYPDGPFDGLNTHLETGSNSPGSETGKMGMGVRFGAAIRAAT